MIGGLAIACALDTTPARAQDVGNGLWQDYRYPASNPFWQDQYNQMVSTWGWNPTQLRPQYNSSPDAVWSANSVSPSNFGTQPFYTVTQWQPYVPRPVDWSGLQYSGANAPPESTTGNHAWYGLNSPGPRSETPEQWREWEANTEQGQEFLQRSGLRRERRLEYPDRNRNQARSPNSSQRPTEEGNHEGPGFKQYFRVDAGKPGKSRWAVRDSRTAPAANAAGPRRVEPFAALPGRGPGEVRRPGAGGAGAAPRRKVTWIYRGPPSEPDFARPYRGLPGDERGAEPPPRPAKDQP
jgi:hypothetical protein